MELAPFVAHQKKMGEALPKNTVLRSPNRGSTCETLCCSKITKLTISV